MPLHDYQCSECGAKLDDQWTHPDCCGRPMSIVWHGWRGKRPFQPFTTKHVNGKPMEITSLAQLRQVERQYGVNFPAYGGTMMPECQGIPQTHWEDDDGHYHND